MEDPLIMRAPDGRDAALSSLQVMRIAMTESANTHGSGAYTKINAAALRALAEQGMGDVEIFLPNSQGGDAVLYRRAGAGLSAPNLDRLTNSGVAEVFLRLDDFHRCANELESQLTDLLTNPHISCQDKAQIANTAGLSVAKDLVQVTPDKESISRVDHVVHSLSKGVLHDPAMGAYLLQMAGHERSTASHMFMVSTLAMLFASEVLGEKEEARIRAIGVAGMLHDLGKLVIPVEILNKPTPLTREELQLIQQHPIESVRILGNDPNITDDIRQMILQHHERIDGRGYPIGVPESELLTESKMLAIVDSFHALIGRRSYRKSMELDQANRVLTTQAGTQFDADLLETWTDLCSSFVSDHLEQGEIEICGEPDEISTRHEHRVMAAGPSNTALRPPRFISHGATMVHCSYAGQLMKEEHSPERFRAIVRDVSRGGLCIETAHPMYRGEIIHVQMDANRQKIWVRSAVAWCQQLEADVFRTGIRFISRVQEKEVNQKFDVEKLDIENESKASDTTAPTNKEPTDAGQSEKDVPTRRKENALAALDSLRTTNRRDRDAQRIVVTLSMSGDLAVRFKAMDQLIDYGTRMSREALILLLRDPNTQIRDRAMEGVATLRVTEAADTLRTMLSEENIALALQAAGALGKIGHHAGMSLVAETLVKGGPEARLATRALSDITGHRFAANDDGVKSAKRYLAGKKLLPAA